MAGEEPGTVVDRHRASNNAKPGSGGGSETGSKRQGEVDQMARMIADCRRFESDNNCSLTIIGEEDEVIAAAAQHAVAAHGHQDSPELRSQLVALLETEDSYVPGARQAEPFPG